MKKIYSLGLSLAFGALSLTAHAQCTPSGTATTENVSVSPENVGIYCQDVAVSQVIQIIAIDEGQIDGNNFSVTSIEITGLENTPEGLGYSCPDACTFTPGTDGFVRGCILIDGTPTAPFDDSIKVNVKINGMVGPFSSFVDSSAKAKIVVNDPAEASCIVGTLDKFEIGSNLSVYPNPSNGASTVNLDLPQGALVRMGMYDVLGNEVSSIQNGFLPAGQNAIPFTKNNSEKGLYLLKVEIDSSTGTNTYTERIIIE